MALILSFILLPPCCLAKGTLKTGLWVPYLCQEVLVCTTRSAGPRLGNPDHPVLSAFRPSLGEGTGKATGTVTGRINTEYRTKPLLPSALWSKPEAEEALSGRETEGLRVPKVASMHRTSVLAVSRGWTWSWGQGDIGQWHQAGVRAPAAAQPVSSSWAEYPQDIPLVEAQLSGTCGQMVT